jgi:(p)ppGpp synthase/HD superfamily hydrolase
MSINAVGIGQVLDIIGIRAVTRHTHDCYELVHRIHREFEALDDEYDDYIAVPKSNGYRSIHTTVIIPGGYPVEIQTRTQLMDGLSVGGSAAHSRYKNKRISRLRFRDCPVGTPSVAQTREE